MTTLITRLFADKDAAAQASDALIARGFDKRSVRTLDGDASATRMAMAEMGVDNAVVDAYEGAMSGGNAVVALRAPFGTVGNALSTLDRYDPVEVEAAEETYFPPVTDPEYATSIIPGNKKFLTARTEIGHSTITGERRNLLSRSQKGKAKVGHSTKLGKRSSLISRNQKGKAKVSHRTFMGKRANLIKQPRAGKSIIHSPTPFSSLLGWPTIIRN